MQNTHNIAAFGASLPHGSCTQSCLERIPVPQLKTVYFLLQHPGSMWDHVATWLPWEIWFVLEVHFTEDRKGLAFKLQFLYAHVPLEDLSHNINRNV